jgi:hypothetical protein
MHQIDKIDTSVVDIVSAVASVGSDKVRVRESVDAAREREQPAIASWVHRDVR